jgi:vacuolar-type H+-ATPase subunit I/STV1|tara:strand:+ start:402 stop:674 length:273 start_codon:yes stop_codon:yes gene_type:complete
MEQKTEKLEQSVIDKLKSIQELQNNMVIGLGQVVVRKREIEKQLEELNSKNIEFGNKLDSSIEEMDSELAELDKKYPNGQIDLDAGTIIY